MARGGAPEENKFGAREGSTNSLHVRSQNESQMEEGTKAARDAFIREYIKDFNGKRAYIRAFGDMKSKGSSIQTAACKMLAEPYVSERVYRFAREIRPEDLVTRGQVMVGLWKEANDEHNDGGVRVQALAHIGKMLGMTTRVDESPQISVNVMLIPVVEIDSWAESAKSMQLKLRERATNNAPPPAPKVIDV